MICEKDGFLIKQNIDSKSNREVTKKQDSLDSEWNFLTISFFSLCLISFLLSIYFSNRNTNIILEKIKLNR